MPYSCHLCRSLVMVPPCVQVTVTVFLFSCDSWDCCVLILCRLAASWCLPVGDSVILSFSVSSTECSLVKLYGQLSIHSIDILVYFILQRMNLSSSGFFFVFPGIHHSKGVYIYSTLVLYCGGSYSVFTATTIQKDLGWAGNLIW